MGASCEYKIYDVFDIFLRKFDNEILTNNYLSPFPVYKSIEEFINSTEDYKGLIVYDTIKYYTGEFIKMMRDSYNVFPDFFVIPEYGQIQIKNNVEYYHVITVSVDSYYDKDRFGINQLKYIHYVANRYRELYETKPTYISNVRIFTKLMDISKPIVNDKFNQYFRRTMSFWIRYCMC